MDFLTWWNGPHGVGVEADQLTASLPIQLSFHFWLMRHQWIQTIRALWLWTELNVVRLFSERGKKQHNCSAGDKSLHWKEPAAEKDGRRSLLRETVHTRGRLTKQWWYMNLKANYLLNENCAFLFWKPSEVSIWYLFPLFSFSIPTQSYLKAGQ